MHRRLAAAATLSAALLLGACTDDAPQPPPPSSGPTMPSPTQTSPKAASTSTSENKHADLLTIQALYKAEFADENRVLKAGGATKLPPAIVKRTSGPYRRFVLDTFQETKHKGIRLIVGGKIIGIAMDSWSPSKVTFRACEDYTGVKSVNRAGHDIGKSNPGARAVQEYQVLKVRGAWRINDFSGKAVKTFAKAPCDGKWYS